MTVVELWPGYRPAEIPVAVFDGTDTWLFGHPAPPEGFAAVRPGVARFRGQHESVRGNTSAELGGRQTATAMIGGVKDLRAAAALVVHEAFHVFERTLGDWAANELDALGAPDAEAGLFAATLREDAALARARELGTPCAAADALAARAKRFAVMPPEVQKYVRAGERHEGIAQYLEDRAVGKPRSWPKEALGPEALRQRVYFSGQSWALLLDRHDVGWRERLGKQMLDEKLSDVLGGLAPCPAEEDVSLGERSRRGVDALLARRAARERELLALARGQVVIEAGEEPLWPKGFDPLNMERLAGGKLAHLRWLKLGNAAGEVELLDRPGVTEPAGAHPLANGIRRLIVPGARAEVGADGVVVVIGDDGAIGRFASASMGPEGLVRLK